MHARARFHTTVLAGVLAGAVTLAGCADDTTSPGAASGNSTTSNATSEQVEFNDADVVFVSGMIPHHEQAVEMAEMLLDAQPRAEITTLAEQIRAEQQPEIDLLNAMLADFGVDADSSGGHAGHGGGGDMPMHAGMMTGAQMEQLDQAQGVEAERMFLQMMIEHHRGAIEAAETELADGVHQPARELAEAIKSSQATEIEQMDQLLTQL
jgi:uncharacterized protein (DUF305 family)